jgi:succinate dehydrogenase flavin-adding protein (antitoxin of CptAB toxin-antitoxin module)
MQRILIFNHAVAVRLGVGRVCRRLEVDLVLGTWAHEHVPGLDEQGLDEFDAILKLETLDVFEWLTGRKTIPKVRRSMLTYRAAAFAVLVAPWNECQARARALNC